MKRLLFSTITLIGLIPILALQCNKDKFNGYDLRFKVQNNSSNTISYLKNSDFPDTLLFETEPFLKANDYFAIPPEKKSSIHITGTTWEKIFSKAPQEIVMLYIIDTETLKKTPWDSIRSQYNILARYDLSLQDLQHRNFVIEYPYDTSLGKLKVYQKL